MRARYVVPDGRVRTLPGTLVEQEMNRPLVYIAGPMTNGTKNLFNLEAIHLAIEMHFQLIEAGFAPICPHLTVFCELMQPHRVPYETWIALDKSYVEAAAAVLRLPGHSPGADREVQWAVEARIPIFYAIESLITHFIEDLRQERRYT